MRRYSEYYFEDHITKREATTLIHWATWHGTETIFDLETPIGFNVNGKTISIQSVMVSAETCELEDGAIATVPSIKVTLKSVIHSSEIAIYLATYKQTPYNQKLRPILQECWNSLKP